MILKLILPSLEIDLSNYEFTLVEENNWLNDSITAKYTFPVEFSVTPEQDLALGNITQENLSVYNSRIDCKFYVLGVEHDAILQIESVIGKNIVANIQYGFEEFPNFNKKLSQLPLQKIDLAQSIYAYAETIIPQTWPDVNFNFPQVITDKLDTSSEQWEFFQGIVNNYAAGDFILNEFDAVNNVQINRNVMHPMPYLMHVLIKGFEDAGYTLEGEILEDQDLIKTTLYALNEFYYNFTGESEVHALNTSEFNSVNEAGNLAEYSKVITFPEPGRYKIAGNVVIRSRGVALPSLFTNVPFSPISGPNSVNISAAKFTYNGSDIWSNNVVSYFTSYKEKFLSVDFNLDFTGTEGTVNFISTQLPYSLLNGAIDTEALLLDITVTQLAKFDVNGDLISTLIEPTSIDLTKAVPDMTFGELVNTLRHKKNYGVDIEGNTIIMNKRKVQNINTANAYNLSPYMLSTPERVFNTGKTFEIKIFDFDSDEYKPEKIFVDVNGYQYMDYVKKDDTQELVLNAIALPLKQQSGVTTAHGFIDDNAKAQFVIYDGLIGGLNLAKDPAPLRLINCYVNDLQDWYEFLISSQAFKWTFTASAESLAFLKIRSIVYAHRQFHVIRKLSRQTYVSQTKGIMLEVDIETENLQ